MVAGWCGVSEANPTEQGLKQQRRREAEEDREAVSEANPTEQGLKQRYLLRP